MQSGGNVSNPNPLTGGPENKGSFWPLWVILFTLLLNKVSGFMLVVAGMAVALLVQPAIGVILMVIGAAIYIFC